jgi:hypothetical protein
MLTLLSEEIEMLKLRVAAMVKRGGKAGHACDLPNIHAFTRGLDLDIDAVIAAVTLPFHSGDRGRSV